MGSGYPIAVGKCSGIKVSKECMYVSQMLISNADSPRGGGTAHVTGLKGHSAADLSATEALPLPFLL